MAKETLLQKEFREKDIRRIRNLVSGNQGDSTQTQVGYSRKHIERKDGDIWEENGKTWTLKNSIKINTRLNFKRFIRLLFNMKVI